MALRVCEGGQRERERERERESLALLLPTTTTTDDVSGRALSLLFPSRFRRKGQRCLGLCGETTLIEESARRRGREEWEGSGDDRRRDASASDAHSGEGGFHSFGD